MIQLPRQFPLYAVADAAGTVVAPVESYLKDLALGDNSPATCRSYANDLLRWLRLLLCAWQVGLLCVADGAGVRRSRNVAQP
ncbi:hypothetical protein AB0D54_28235 [Streptomyces xanthophaeus]|uniref:hypothetical protein n=1 Tax=Streptomyces xanthophaeus TaxID=67385 RepID=UPI00343269D2